MLILWALVMRNMAKVLSLSFMQRALVIGTIVGLLAGYYGVFIVQRRLSYLSAGLAHSCFAGIALGLLLGLDPIGIAIPFTLFVALAMNWSIEKSKLEGDTIVGVFLSLAMAFGIIFLALKKEYSADAFSYLFGSLLAVSSYDVYLGIGTFGLSVLFLPAWSRWAYVSFDKELSLADRQPVVFQNYLLFGLLALTTTISVKILGVLLVTACLVIPPAIARMISQTFRQMTLFSVALGGVTVPAGLLASYELDFPSG